MVSQNIIFEIFVIRSHSFIRTNSWLAAIAGKVCSLVGFGGKTTPSNLIEKKICSAIEFVRQID